MGLRSQAVADLRSFLEDSAGGFGWPITVTDPSGHSASLTGYASDISQMYDPSTGELISGRRAEVTLHLSSLAAAGLGIPDNVDDSTSKPWVVAFNDPLGNTYTFKVADGAPDRELGCVVLSLEAYKP
jgi:hypothetical protein